MKEDKTKRCNFIAYPQQNRYERSEYIDVRNFIFEQNCRFIDRNMKTPQKKSRKLK